jgi:hypothetical protein
MPHIEAPAASANCTADGTALGYVTVADNAPFFPGCEAWLKNDNGSQRCLITDLVSTDQVGLRFLEEENCGSKLQPGHYGRSDCSAYTLLTNSRLYMPQQPAPVDPAYDKPLA